MLMKQSLEKPPTIPWSKSRTWGFPGDSVVKDPPTAQRLKCLSPIRKTQVQSLGREDPLEKEMVTHSSILAWRIPPTEKPVRLQSMGSWSQAQLKQLSTHARS